MIFVDKHWLLTETHVASSRRIAIPERYRATSSAPSPLQPMLTCCGNSNTPSRMRQSRGNGIMRGASGPTQTRGAVMLKRLSYPMYPAEKMLHNGISYGALMMLVLWQCKCQGESKHIETPSAKCLQQNGLRSIDTMHICCICDISR